MCLSEELGKRILKEFKLEERYLLESICTHVAGGMLDYSDEDMKDIENRKQVVKLCLVTYIHMIQDGQLPKR